MSYPISRLIWTDHMIEIPINWMCNEDNRLISLQFDPSLTQIISAELNVRVYSDWGDGHAEVFMNGSQVISLQFGEWDVGVWKEETADVTGFILNGDNRFKCRACTNDILHFMGRAFWVYGTLMVTYSGQDPNISDPKDDNQDFWRTMRDVLLWSAIGLGGLYVAVKVVPPLLELGVARKALKARKT